MKKKKKSSKMEHLSFEAYPIPSPLPCMTWNKHELILTCILFFDLMLIKRQNVKKKNSCYYLNSLD